MLWKADPTFYPSPKLAGQAPSEKLAYVAALNPNGGTQPDALVVVDVDPKSKKYGEIVARWRCRTREMNCIISAGTRVVPLSARTRRTRCPFREHQACRDVRGILAASQVRAKASNATMGHKVPSRTFRNLCVTPPRQRT
jgi:hypothetical protein